VVWKLDDCQAAEVRFLENADRKSLNPAEEAAGLQILQSLGHTPESLAELVRIPADDVNRKLALLELPAFWQRWLRSDDRRRGPAAELLVEWIDFPQVLDAMQTVIENKRWPMSLVEWRRELTEAILRLTRDADPQSPVGPAFKLTDELRPRLEVREVFVGKKRQQRCFNVCLFDELQDRANAPAPSPARASADGGRTSGSGNRRSEVGSRKPETNGRPSANPPSAIPAPEDGGLDDGDFRERFERWWDGYLRKLIAERITRISDLGELLASVEALGIEIREEWRRPPREFLELHNGRQLWELAESWGVDLKDCRDVGECVAVILHARPRELPPVITELCAPADAAL